VSESANLNPPSEAGIRAADDLILESICEFCGLAGSYAISASEAAPRGDRLTLRVHLMQLRLCVIEALKAHKDLSFFEVDARRAG
jgi:hypothetical protein